MNRQIRRMCEYFDYEVTKLERIQVMNIKLGNLGQGNWRNLTTAELEELFTLLEESKAVVQTKKPANSNKKMNKALEQYDLKTNYRKASSVAKQTPKNKVSSTATHKTYAEAMSAKDRPKKKKEAGGP
ncbi:MAG: 23S rRNA pseudouridine(2604) synthase RluF, partial [Tannerellaceae bacterium]|nr:23S rRNA pseudouridine(2604) synthase RluF [Tannerellaceae bacterium]